MEKRSQIIQASRRQKMFDEADTRLQKALAHQEIKKDDLNNLLKRSTFIYTSYIKGDNKKLKDFIAQIYKQERLETKDMRKLKKIVNEVVRSTVNRFKSQTKIYEYDKDYLFRSGSKYKYAHEFEEYYTIYKEDIEAIQEKVEVVLNSFVADIKKAKVLNKFDVDVFNNRRDIITSTLFADIKNTSAQKVAEKEGFRNWIWGGSYSKNPREDHQALYGKKSKIGVSPAEGGEYPGEIANCKCQMIFVR